MPVALLVEKSELQEMLDTAVKQVVKSQTVPEWMTLSQVCEYTQYTRVTILNFIKKKKFPVSYPCNSPRFQKSAVDIWMNEYKNLKVQNS